MGSGKWEVGSGKWLVGERDLSGKLFDWGIWSKIVIQASIARGRKIQVGSMNK